jgi:apolipoprotein N-acyltransferase
MSLGVTILLGMCGAVATAFASGRCALPIAAWLAPLALLVVSRSLAPTLAISGVAVALVVGIWLANRGVIPAPPLATAAIATMIAFVALVPYVADLVITPHLSRGMATLVFPLALAAIEFGASRWSPYGTWGAVAQSQVGNLPLMQLVAFTGVPGIAFMVGWFASVGASIVLGSMDVRAVTAFAFALGGVMVLGAARLAFAAAPKGGMRVAAIGWPDGVLTQQQVMRRIAPG